MKLFPVLFLIVFVCGKPESKAQSVLPPIGAEWWYEYYSGMMAPPFYNGYATIIAIGDTMVGSQLCRELKEEWFWDGIHVGYSRNAFIYEDSGKIFYRVDSVFALLYDFNHSVGDTMLLEGGMTGWGDSISNSIYIVDSVQQIALPGDTLTCFVAHNPGSPWGGPPCWTFFSGNPTPGSIIEKIGASSYYFPTNQCVADYGQPAGLRCYAETGNIIWHPSTYPCDSSWEFWGINEISNSNFILYPNPVANILFVEFYSPENLPKEFVVFDALGRKISTLIPERTSAFNFQIDVHTLASGIYFLRIGNQFARFVKE